MKIAFLGLGVMGAPMARHLAQSGHEVSVYNRTSAKAQTWQEQNGGRVAQTPKEAAKDAEIVFSCVGNDQDLREVTLGQNGAFQAMSADAIYVDHTTTSAKIARELYDEAKSMGFNFLDAPVSGGQAGAENGQLAIMCGGDAAIFARALPVMSAYGKTISHIGEAGAGQQCKMVNQIAIAGLVQGLSEALAFLQCAGLDGEKVLGVITKGAAGSWQMANRGETMLADEFEFGFAVDWMRKDLGIVLDEGKEIGADLSVTKLVDHYYSEVQEMGGGRWDTSSLIRRLPKA